MRKLEGPVGWELNRTKVVNLSFLCGIASAVAGSSALGQSVDSLTALVTWSARDTLSMAEPPPALHKARHTAEHSGSAQ